MNRRFTRAILLTAASLLTVFAVESRATTGWTLEGCWSPYPNCVGAKDVYVDSSGHEWECGACGTTRNPPTGCYQVGSLHTIGYWCS